MSSSVAPTEIAQFSAHAGDWWNPHGKFQPLHRLNPVRVGYVRDQACRHFGRTPSRQSLKGLTVLDVGCGGGLLAEPLARLGAKVTAVDASAPTIAVAKEHAAAMRLVIDYKMASVEELVAQLANPPLAGGSIGKANRGGVYNDPHPSPAKTKDLLRKSKFSLPLPQGERNKYDIITALEVAEHVADMDSFFVALRKLLKPKGLLVMSTLNRTPKSFLLGIVAAEYILQWVPRGTHEWKKFIRPSELVRRLEGQGLDTHDLTGLVFNPLRNEFELSKTDLAVNYLLTATAL